MKKSFFYLIIGLLFVTNYSYVFAQSSSSASSSSEPIASTSATPSEKKDIQDLKDRLEKAIATKQKDQKAVSGFATVKDSKVTIKDADDLAFTIGIDNALTKLYQINGSAKREIKNSDLKTGMYIIASGPIVDSTINANTVYVDEAYTVQSGQITNIDKANYSITVMTQDKESVRLDIESSTKQNMLNIKTLEIETTGFSKIKEGDTIHFSAKTDAGTIKSNKLTAQKILIIPQEYFMK